MKGGEDSPCHARTYLRVAQPSRILAFLRHAWVLHTTNSLQFTSTGSSEHLEAKRYP